MKKAIESEEVYVAQQMRAALTAFAPLRDCMLDTPDKEDWYRAGKTEVLTCAAGAAFPAMSHFPVVRIAPLGLLFALVDHFGGDPREKYERVWSGLSREQRLAVADSWIDWLTCWEQRQELSWPPRYFEGFWFQQSHTDGVAYVALSGASMCKGEIVWLRGGKWSRSPFNHTGEEPRWLAGVIDKLNEELGV